MFDRRSPENRENREQTNTRIEMEDHLSRGLSVFLPEVVPSDFNERVHRGLLHSRSPQKVRWSTIKITLTSMGGACAATLVLLVVFSTTPHAVDNRARSGPSTPSRGNPESVRLVEALIEDGGLSQRTISTGFSERSGEFSTDTKPTPSSPETQKTPSGENSHTHLQGA